MEDFDRLLWALVHKYIRHNKQRLSGALQRTEDDLYSVACEAAVVAISRYKHNKGMKLSTWVAERVKTALLDSNRTKKTQVQFGIKQDAALDESGEYTLEEIEFDLTMRQLLSPLLYKVFRLKFVESRTEEEIASLLGYSRKKVRECLSRICQRYESLEMNLNKALTTRRRQDRFLNSSDQSLSV